MRVSRCKPYPLGNLLRPSVFVRAAEMVGGSDLAFGLWGACVAIREAVLDQGGMNYIVPREFFASLYREDSPDPDRAFYFGLISEENQDHRVFALLFAAEMAKDHNAALKLRRAA